MEKVASERWFAGSVRFFYFEDDVTTLVVPFVLQKLCLINLENRQKSVTQMKENQFQRLVQFSVTYHFKKKTCNDGMFFP